MLAARITLAHFSVSSANSFPNSIGESGIGTLPSSASRALIFGSARPALISRLSFSTISLGVALGAPTPVQYLPRNPAQSRRWSRHLGQCLPARRRGYAERTQLAGSDIFKGRHHIAERGLYLPADRV